MTTLHCLRRARTIRHTRMVRHRQAPFVAALILALAVSGLLPPDHLHTSAPGRAQVIHAHWEPADSRVDRAVSAEHDDHDDAVTLDRVMTVGRSLRQEAPPAALPPVAGASTTPPADNLVCAVHSQPGPSPPPRRIQPRAPPA